MIVSASRPVSGTTTEDPVTLPYKKIFPAAWIISTAETRAFDRAKQGLTSDSDGLSLIPPATPQTLVRESVPPAALFIQQAGLASPAMSASPIGSSSLSSHKEGKVDKRKKASDGANDQAKQPRTSKPNQSSGGPSVRGTMKKLLPKFLSTKPTPETKTPNAEKRKAYIAGVQKDVHTLSKRREPFTWPENTQNTASSSRYNMSGLESVPEGSQVKLTEESLGLAGDTSASPYGSAVARRIQGVYPEEPMTAGTGISSRSSNYADVPSRLPEFSPGYSPMA